MVPNTGRARSFLLFQKQNREEGETEYKQQAYQFTQGYNILHILQVHHPIITFIIHNKYIIYIHTYIHTYIYILFQSTFINDTVFSKMIQFIL